MVKYYNCDIVFREIPDRVSLAINITNCQNNCANCHSQHLKTDIGMELTDSELLRLISDNSGIDCVAIMGEGNDTKRIVELGKLIKNKGLKSAIYSGCSEINEKYLDVFDYIKIGEYDEAFGSLDKPTTNQRLFEKNEIGLLCDITYKFWR